MGERIAISCTGKQGFNTKKDADWVAGKTRKQGGGRDKVGAFAIHSYKCRVCGMWHVGSGRSAERRLKARRRAITETEMTE